MGGITGFDSGGPGHIVAVAEGAAIMEIFKFGVLKFTEKTVLVKFCKIHIFFGEGIIFEEVVNFAGFFDSFDDFDAFSGSVKRGDFAHDMETCFKCADGMFCMIHEKSGDQYSIHIFVIEKLIFVICDECFGTFFPESVTHDGIDVTSGDDIDVEFPCSFDESTSASESPDAEADTFVCIEKISHFLLLEIWLKIIVMKYIILHNYNLQISKSVLF